MKTCSFCSKEVEDKESRCPDCGKSIDEDPSTPPRKIKWYFRNSSLIISFLLAGPFMLPLVWMHPTYSRTRKIVLSLIILGLTLLLTVGAVVILKSLLEYYHQLSSQIKDIHS